MRPDEGESFPIEGRSTLVGRSVNADIMITDASVSREHAEIRFDGSRISVRNLESKNGVQVNGKHVDQASLKVGDTLRLGRCLFLVDTVQEKP